MYLHLKKKRTYYCQIQLGLFLFGLNLGKLIIFSKCDSSFVEIDVPYDENFCKEVFISLNELYFQKYLLFLMSNKRDVIGRKWMPEPSI